MQQNNNAVYLNVTFLDRNLAHQWRIASKRQAQILSNENTLLGRATPSLATWILIPGQR